VGSAFIGMFRPAGRDFCLTGFGRVQAWREVILLVGCIAVNR
jgi:hypothetical protein